MRRPPHSRMVVAVPMKKREALVDVLGALVGCSLVSWAGGREVGGVVGSCVGGPVVEGVMWRCFIVDIVCRVSEGPFGLEGTDKDVLIHVSFASVCSCDGGDEGDVLRTGDEGAEKR